MLIYSAKDSPHVVEFRGVNYTFSPNDVTDVDPVAGAHLIAQDRFLVEVSARNPKAGVNKAAVERAEMAYTEHIRTAHAGRLKREQRTGALASATDRAIAEKAADRGVD